MTLLLSFVASTPVGPDATSDSAFSLDPYTVTLLFGLIIPVINGIATKASTPAWVKAVVTLVLSAVSGLVTVGLTDGGGSVISQSALKSAGLAFVVAVATYAGLWKPFGVTSTPNGNGEAKLAGVGVKDKAPTANGGPSGRP